MAIEASRLKVGSDQLTNKNLQVMEAIRPLEEYLATAEKLKNQLAVRITKGEVRMLESEKKRVYRLLDDWQQIAKFYKNSELLVIVNRVRTLLPLITDIKEGKNQGSEPLHIGLNLVKDDVA